MNKLEEPKVDQLSAILELVKASSPYVDLAIWGPHGLRTQKQMKLAGMVPGPGGTFRYVEFRGGPDNDHWKVCFMIYFTAVVMIQAVSPPWLAAYVKYIGKFAMSFRPEILGDHISGRRAFSQRTHRTHAST